MDSIESEQAQFVDSEGYPICIAETEVYCNISRHKKGKKSGTFLGDFHTRCHIYRKSQFLEHPSDLLCIRNY